MQDDYLKSLKKKTSVTANLYFDGYSGERPFDLWASFDKRLALDFSLFITGQMYARERLPHPTRQMVAVAALTALERTDELRLHLHAALNVGCDPHDLAEAIFQVGVYAGIPVVNSGLKVLKSLLQERGQWPLSRNETMGTD